MMLGTVGLLGRHHQSITTIDPSTHCGFNSTLAAVAGAYPTADLAIYVPVRVKHRVVVKKLYAAVVGVSGNIDVGVYDAAGTKLVSTGTQAAAAAFINDVTDTTIGPGLYYLAVTCDNTTATMTRDSDAAPQDAMIGVLTEQLAAGAALPATATWAMNNTLAFYPALAMLVDATIS